MGAGSFPAGLGVAGGDPVYVPAAGVAPALPLAAKYDPATRRFVENADGSIASVHPVDQRVALLLTVEQGAIPSQAAIGARIRARILRLAPALIPAVALDEVRTVLKPLIDAKDVLLVSVQVDASVVGRVAIAVTYVNLRDPGLNVQSPLLGAQRLSIH